MDGGRCRSRPRRRRFEHLRFLSLEVMVSKGVTELVDWTH